jgi:arylsulfatase A-like enzyme
MLVAPGMPAATARPRTEPESREDRRSWRLAAARGVLGRAAWFGLVVGLAELGLVLGQKRLRDPSPLFFRMNRHVVWMVPLADLTLFVGIGLVPAALAMYRPRLAARLADRLFSFLGPLAALLTHRPFHGGACVVLALGVAYRLSRRIGRNERRFRSLVRRSLPALGVVAAALIGSSFFANVVAARRPPAGVSPAPRGAPNVLLIVLDTVRADRLSGYGYHRPTTPNLDRLAGRGIRFTQARSTAPWTLPSHASIMTGRWPHELGADFSGPLDAAFPTLAEFLTAGGYATAGFVANRTYAGAETGLDRGFSHYEDHEVSPLGVLRCSALGGRIIWPLIARDECVGHPDELPDRKDAAEVCDELLGWLAGRPGDRPFFAFLNFYDAHNPYIPPGDFRRRFSEPPKSTADRVVLLEWFIQNKASLPARQRRLALDAYDDCLAHIDEQLGRLFDELGRRGRLEDTLVIVTADHGEHFGEHDLYGHASSLYDQEVRVPLLIVPPQGGPAGRVVEQPVSLRDIAATVADLTGLGIGAPFPGRSLARWWAPGAEPASEADRAVLVEVEEPAKASPNQGRSPIFRGAMKAVVADGKAYIRNGDGVEELYDLQVDPGETHDLAGSPESRPELERFRGELRRLLGGAGVRVRRPRRRAAHLRRVGPPQPRNP